MRSYLATTLPWSQIQTYISTLKTHDNQIAMLTKLKEEGILGINDLEINITKSLIQFNETMDKILRDNNLI